MRNLDLQEGVAPASRGQIAQRAVGRIERATECESVELRSFSETDQENSLRRNTGWVAQQGGVAQASPRVASSAGASDQSLGGTVDRRGRLGEGVVLEVPENEHIDGGQLGCLLGEGKCGNIRISSNRARLWKVADKLRSVTQALLARGGQWARTAADRS